MKGALEIQLLILDVSLHCIRQQVLDRIALLNGLEIKS
jgi:hypothetical protein